MIFNLSQIILVLNFGELSETDCIHLQTNFILWQHLRQVLVTALAWLTITELYLTG